LTKLVAAAGDLSPGRLCLACHAGPILAFMYRTRLYRKGVLEAEGFPVADVSDHLADPSAVVWFDLCEPTAEDLASISEELGLHPLAVEDAVQEHQRPKVDRYASHLFVTAYAVAFDMATGELTVREIDAFVTPNALVTVRKSLGFDIDAVIKHWDQSPDLAVHGTGFLLYGLLDYVVDTHFETVLALDTEVEGLEDGLFEENPKDQQMQIRTFRLRKSLVTLRRVVLPMREVVNSLMRRDLQVIDAEMGPYYQDVYDHVLRATEWTESLRDLVTTILETHLTVRGNRLNVIMKQVTSWAAIIAVPTAVTGFYGQNVPYPGFGHVTGLWASILLTVGLAVGLYIVFKRKDWL
jgi:magnesium transporter